MRILLASPRSFCAGVVMATECLERVLELLGAPIYVYLWRDSSRRQNNPAHLPRRPVRR